MENILNKDHLKEKEENFEKALEALKGAGYSILR